MFNEQNYAFCAYARDGIHYGGCSLLLLLLHSYAFVMVIMWMGFHGKCIYISHINIYVGVWV